MLLWLFATCVLAGAHAVSVGDSCTMPGNSQGVCKRVRDCPVMLAKLTQRPMPSVADRTLLRTATKKCPVQPAEKRNPGICCAVDGPTEQGWINEPGCGLADTPKIFGGIQTKIGEFPWMALLGYMSDDNSRIDFNCGGTLINKHWVLTAAHCISNNLRKVRLGEHDLTQNPDCEEEAESEEDPFCFPEPLDVDVLRSVKHPEYVRRTVTNDIALVELETPVTYTDEIKPICLPVNEAGRLNLEGLTMTVAGWGRTEDTDTRGSPVLLKLLVPIATQAKCNQAYKSRARISEKQMCAGGEKNQDSCNGDSGGSLMMTTSLGGSNPWTQFGVVSYGPAKCGSQGVPGVYTRVSAYLPWIVSVTQ